VVIVTIRFLSIGSVFVLVGEASGASFCAVGQEAYASSNRKVVTRIGVVPQYSSLARGLRLSRLVKVEVVVESNVVSREWQ
jgi:hypothetical protein